MDREVVRGEMEQARQTFHRLLDSATVADLSRPSNGTKWTNGQLLFHMLFGYLIVVRLMALVPVRWPVQYCTNHTSMGYLGR